MDLHLNSAILAFRNAIEHPYLPWISLKAIRVDGSYGPSIRATFTSFAEPSFALGTTQKLTTF